MEELMIKKLCKDKHYRWFTEFDVNGLTGAIESHYRCQDCRWTTKYESTLKSHTCKARIKELTRMCPRCKGKKVDPIRCGDCGQPRPCYRCRGKGKELRGERYG